MTATPLVPLADIPIAPLIAALPKADLHLHQEERPRLDRIVARRQGREPYDWRQSVQRLLTEVPPGIARLGQMATPDASLPLEGIAGDDPEDIIAKIADLLEEGAADGAVLIEVRVGPAGGGGFLQPDFMALFREAERRVQASYPHLRAEAISFLMVSDNAAQRDLWERCLEGSLRAARAGLRGVDFRVDPYHTEADPALWATACQWAARAADAGLGVTVHVAEFSTANLAAALLLPGLSRLGHAVYAAADPRLLDAVARSGVTVEFSVSCNVVLGAVPSYEAHPLRRFVEHGIPVTLNTDDPVRICTTIGREYAIAASLGFTAAELLTFTRNAVRASFTTPARRAALLADLDAWALEHLTADR